LRSIFTICGMGSPSSSIPRHAERVDQPAGAFGHRLKRVYDADNQQQDHRTQEGRQNCVSKSRERRKADSRRRASRRHGAQNPDDNIAEQTKPNPRTHQPASQPATAPTMTPDQ